MGDMNAPLRTRIRDGCRGGREQFKWNQIKDQDFKDREQYLGSSTKVGLMGKFGRYHVHDWYARNRDTPEGMKEELQTVQAYEEELMQEALGLKPKKLMLSKKQLSEEELKEFLKRDDDKSEDKKGRTQMGPQKKIVTNEYGEQIATSNEDYIGVAAREAQVKGLGFAFHRTGDQGTKLEEIKAKTFGTESTLLGSSSSSSSLLKTEMKTEVKDEIKTEVKTEFKREDDDDTASIVDGLAPLMRGSSMKREPSMSALGREDRKERKRERSPEARTKSEKKDKKRKKEEKKLKKAEKKLKKAHKKEKKSVRKARKAEGKTVSSSSSSSS